MSGEVKWKDDMKALFERLMANIPSMFRGMAKKATCAKAEENARERGSEFVEADDIARACLSEAPSIFHVQIINDLKREGIDAEKHL